MMNKRKNVSNITFSKSLFEMQHIKIIIFNFINSKNVAYNAG